MKKLVLAAVAAVSMLAAAVPPAEAQRGQVWHSISMTLDGDGWGYAEGYDEEEARANAMFQCQIAPNYNCGRGISVPLYWYLTGIYCENRYGGHSYVAGSQWSFSQADENAYQKARNGGYSPYYDCYVVVRR